MFCMFSLLYQRGNKQRFELTKIRIFYITRFDVYCCVNRIEILTYKINVINVKVKIEIFLGSCFTVLVTFGPKKFFVITLKLETNSGRVSNILLKET